MAAGAAAGFAGYEWAQGKLTGRATIHLGDTSPVSVPSGASPVGSMGALCKDTCNYLVLGSDSRATLSSKDQQGFQTNAEIGGYRSDTMLLVHIVAATKHATVVSFPRDLLVDIPGYGQNKINAAFSLGAANGGKVPGGAVLAAKTVQELTGLEINHVMVVDLGGFEAIVNAMGTVPFCTPVPLVDDPSKFPDYIAGEGGSGLNMPHSGCYDLTGADALALVRARHVIAGGVPDCISDFARIGRQQQFMRSLMNKLLSPSMLPKLPHLVDVITKQLYFDDKLRVTDLVDLSKALQGVASGNADFRTIPSQLAANHNDVVLSPDAKVFMDKLRHDQPLGDLGTSLQGNAPTPGNIAVRVYDDASEGHAPNDVYTAQLSESGFKMMATSSEPAPAALQGMGTTILYNKGYEEQAKVVAQYVPGPYPIKEAKPGQLPSDTQVGVVVDVHYRYLDPGSGKTTTVNPNCSL
jgi:LCP family protein required for cell wall assembly